MEEDDEIRSRASPAYSRSPDSSFPPVGRTTEVTVAASGLSRSPPLPPASSLTQNASASAALPAQASGGGGREDCWSEGATAVLIDAWGKRYLELSRGNLKQKHWKEVAENVSSRENFGKSPKTDVQCKNRIDTVKKKYKQEKARMAAGGASSRWIFFEKLDRLIGATAKSPGGDGGFSHKLPMGIPLSGRSNLYHREARTTLPPQRAAARRSIVSTRWCFRKSSASETESESEPELSADSVESLPSPPSRKRVQIARTGGGGGRELRKLELAVSRFCEAYEKAETAKLKQMVEMEEERLKFLKELELQRMEFFLKTQTEISQLKQHKRRNNGEEGEGIRRNTSNDHNVKNNNDVHSRMKKKKVMTEDKLEFGRDETRSLDETAAYFALQILRFCGWILRCIQVHLVQTLLYVIEHFLDGSLDIPE